MLPPYEVEVGGRGVGGSPKHKGLRFSRPQCGGVWDFRGVGARTEQPPASVSWLFLAFICVAALMGLKWRPGEVLTEARIQPGTPPWAGGRGGAPLPLGKQKLSAKSVYPDPALRGRRGGPWSW